MKKIENPTHAITLQKLTYKIRLYRNSNSKCNEAKKFLREFYEIMELKHFVTLKDNFRCQNYIDYEKLH